MRFRPFPEAKSQTRSVVAVAASCLAHVGLWWMGTGPVDTPREPARLESEVWMEVQASPEPVAALAPQLPERQPLALRESATPTPTPVPTTLEQPERPASRRRERPLLPAPPVVVEQPAPGEAEVEASVASEATQPPAEPAPGPAPRGAAPDAAGVRALDLSPRAVASGFVHASQSAATGSVTAESAGRTAGSAAQADQVAVPGLLKRESDGTFSYKGTGFQAKVARDGSVSMRNSHGGFTKNGASFDLAGMLESAAGNDPYRSERKAFMEATRALRDQLRERADVAALRRQLKQIRQRPGLSMAARKNATFEAWDQMSEDEVGLSGRRAVERFIREFYAEPDFSAYTQAELQQLNARRHSRRLFAPYRADEAG